MPRRTCAPRKAWGSRPRSSTSGSCRPSRWAPPTRPRVDAHSPNGVSAPSPDVEEQVMEIVRYLIEAAGAAEMPRIGVREADGTLRRVPTRTLAELLALPLAAFREALSSATEVEGERYRLLAPVDSLTEVWAAGVTYRRSRE